MNMTKHVRILGNYLCDVIITTIFLSVSLYTDCYNALEKQLYDDSKMS